MAGGEPTIVYYKIRGRAEVVKVAYAIAGQKFKFEEVDPAQLKADFETYPFGQVPILKVEGSSIPQTIAQLRYVGRAHTIYGDSNLEAAMIDALLEGLTELGNKLVPAMKAPETERAGVIAAFWAAHIDPASKVQANGGVHLAFIANLINKHGHGYAIGSRPSIADAALFGCLDILTAVYGDTWKTLFPEIAAIMVRVGEIPTVQAYLASNQRL